MRFKNWTALRCLLALLPALLPAARVAADPGSLKVRVNEPGVKISPMFYGLMTEEINHAYDGGLYAELIQNRAFKDNRNNPVHWSLVQEGGGAGSMALDNGQPLNEALPTSLKVEVTTASAKQRVGVANTGFWGIPVEPGTRYRASFYAKADASFNGPLALSIENGDGTTIYAKATVAHITSGWKQYTVTLTTGKVTPSNAGRFVLAASTPGTFHITQVSLFPPTFHNRQNGLRRDLMELMGAMQPAFLRLPGGNYLEGNTIAERFDFKTTLGDPATRPGHQCPWGYRSSDGLGLLEYLEWCEDLKMEPVLAVFAGYALNGEHVAAGPGLNQFVQDALDEIEYLTGDASTKWGARRIKDGHPATFPLRYVEIGNEDEFDRSGSYDGRFGQFYDAIKAKYPRLQLIATAPVKSRTPDVIDDHYYRSARAMASDSGHYDKYSRSGPKIFVGEWASTEGSPTPTLKAALGDAAWLTGLERNSDLVVLESYAPLLVNVNNGARQWGTNLIGYDSLTAFGSPSYYVQKMFGTNRGDVVLPVDLTPQKRDTPTIAPLPHGGVGVGTWSTQAEYKDFEVIQDGKPLFKQESVSGTNDWKLGQGNWHAIEGVLRQSSRNTDCRAITGKTDWGNYTYRLKARKLSGAEGFLIMFHVQDENNFLWWNIGGWGNSRTVIEKASDGGKGEIGTVSDVKVETGRWYDIRIEVAGRDIRCYLDGKLITSAVDAPGVVANPLYATASRDLSSGEVILKVVNFSDQSQQLLVNLLGLDSVQSNATGWVLSGQPNDVNTVEAPQKVAPKPIRLDKAGNNFEHTFPAYSVTVLRVKAK